MERKIKHGIIHIHSENSLKDSALKMNDLVRRAGELGAPGIVLTDHGTLTGTEDFRKEVSAYNKENGTDIKAIPGVEAYCEEDDDLTHRAHLLLIPKDRIGYRAISKAVTASNHRLDSQNIPRMNMEILKNHFGPGQEGHGHVIATSACMQGVIASILNQNKFIENDMKKLDAKRSKISSPNDPQYLAMKKNIANTEEEIQQLSERIKELTVIAKKPYVKKEKALKAFLGTPEYETYKQNLDAEKAESENAKVEVEHLKDLREAKKAEIKEPKKECKSAETSHERWYSITKAIEDLKSSLASDEYLYQKARERAKVYSSLFGDNNFYAELQYHRIPEEAKLMPLVASIAEELKLPLVAANDAHMAGNSESELKARQIMRSLRFNKWELQQESDKELYIKTDEELSNILSEILPREIVDRAINGISDIIDACNVVFEYESHYPVFDKPAPARLRELCSKGIEWRYPERKGWTEEHNKRMKYELDIIEKLGFCDYLVIVEDFLRYGRLLGKMDVKNPDPRYLADPYNMELLAEITKDEVGLGIGPGRGSGVGSLVDYLIGITGVDPMLYGLYFERFLNVERVSPPDIDSDIASEIRDQVIDYVKHKYGENAVCCIMTKQKQQAKAAIRSCARLLGSERYDDTAYYLDLGDEICKSVPKELNIKLNACMKDLTEKYKDNEAALEILHNATLIEDTFTNIGMHAAGVIIADNGDVREYVPLCYIPGKKQFATQCDKGQAEAMGLLKMDFLGLKNLDTITHALRIIKQRHGISIDIEKVPLEKEVFSNIFATGNTNSIFQFESAGMKELLTRFNPDCIQHITLLNAMYRPGPIQFIDDVIAVKNGKKKPDYVVPEMETILGETYGYPVYQEQLMSVFNKFAGFSLGEADIIRRAMAKKKVKEFTSYKDKFVEGMIEKGGKRKKVEAFWEQLLKFAEYAFNKSHSCAYAFVAYYTAWLKYHYPEEYATAVLITTKLDKIGQVIRDCKNSNITILPPDINLSENDFSLNDTGIVYGLGYIKNVGNRANAIVEERKNNGKFLSFADFVIRTKAEKDIMESFVKAGVFDSFCPNRKALLHIIPEYADCLKKIKTKEKALIELDETDEKAKKYKAQLKSLINELNSIEIDFNASENQYEKLLNEKDMLGAFISAHPLDYYDMPTEDGFTTIDKVNGATYSNICGIITELKITKRKNDGKSMAFFTLEDQTGSIDVCCFTKQFKKYASLLSEDAVVQIKGMCQAETIESGDEEEVVLKIILDNIIPLKEKKNSIILYVDSVIDWTDNVRYALNPFLDKDGYPLVIYDKLEGIFRKTKLKVSKDIINNQSGWKTIAT